MMNTRLETAKQLQNQRLEEKQYCEKCGQTGWFNYYGIKVLCSDCDDSRGVYEEDRLECDR